MNRRAFFGLFAGVAAALGFGRKAVAAPKATYFFRLRFDYPVDRSSIFRYVRHLEALFDVRLWMDSSGTVFFPLYSDTGTLLNSIIVFLQKENCSPSEGQRIWRSIVDDMSQVLPVIAQDPNLLV